MPAATLRASVRCRNDRGCRLRYAHVLHAARVRLRGTSRPADLLEGQAGLAQLARERDAATSRKDFDRAKDVEQCLEDRKEA